MRRMAEEVSNKEAESVFAHSMFETSSAMRLMPLHRPAIRTLTKNQFYSDPDRNFKSVLLYGLEGDLMTFMCWSFGLWFYISDRSSAAAAVSYATHLAIVWLRGHFGKNNISLKTMVPMCFLI